MLFYGFDLIRSVQPGGGDFTIYKPSSRNKIILTVMDNGVGIQEQD